MTKVQILDLKVGDKIRHKTYGLCLVQQIVIEKEAVLIKPITIKGRNLLHSDFEKSFDEEISKKFALPTSLKDEWEFENEIMFMEDDFTVLNVVNENRRKRLKECFLVMQNTRFGNESYHNLR